jgi:hypothetical protein
VWKVLTLIGAVGGCESVSKEMTPAGPCSEAISDVRAVTRWAIHVFCSMLSVFHSCVPRFWPGSRVWIMYDFSKTLCEDASKVAVLGMGKKEGESQQS